MSSTLLSIDSVADPFIEDHINSRDEVGQYGRLWKENHLEEI